LDPDWVWERAAGLGVLGEGQGSLGEGQRSLGEEAMEAGRL
jgi:hypothetical protein